MSIFSRLFALAAALCCFPAAGADIEALLRAKWVQAESPHFRVVTDQKADTARQLVNDLERMRHFSLRARGMDALEGIAPLTVLAIGDPDLFEKAGMPENYGGVFSTSLNGYAAIAKIKGYIGNGDVQTFARAVLLHEYHHFLVRMTPLTQAYPMWYDEGMAEYFSTFRYDNTTVRVGDIDELENRIEGLYSASGNIEIDSATLFNTTKLDYASTTRTNKFKLDEFYARAGFVIHYFNSSPELRAQLAHYVRVYNLGIGQDRAARIAFKRSYAELNKDITQYLARRLSARVFAATDGPFKFPAVEIKVEALDRARTAAALAAVLPMMSVPREAIDAVLAVNLQLNPDSAQANIDALRFSRKGYSSAAVDALAARFPGDARLLAMQGELLLQHAQALRGSGLPGEQAQLIKARDLFRRAVKADPGYPDSYYGLGQVYLGLPDSEPLDEGLVGFDTAAIFESRPAMFRGLATLALRAKAPELALVALRQAVTFAKPDGYNEDALLLDNMELLHELNNTAPVAAPDGLTYKNGTRYVGQVRGLKPEGAGKLQRINGSYIEATFRDGLPVTGKLVSERGGEYEGQFSAGLAGGQGALRYPAGAPATGYVGGVALGKPSGRGVLSSAAGRHEGEFLDGEAHGEGSFAPAAAPQAVRGRWLYGRYLWPASEGEVFVGGVNAKGEASGAGYCHGTGANSSLGPCRRGGDQAKADSSEE